MKGPSGRPTSAEAAWSIVQERPRGTLDSRVKRRVEEVSSGRSKHLSKASSIDKEDNEGSKLHYLSKSVFNKNRKMGMFTYSVWETRI